MLLKHLPASNSPDLHQQRSSSSRLMSSSNHVRSSYVDDSRINLSISSSNLLNNSMRIAGILRDLSNTVQFAPLAATCSIALTILECIQTASKMKEDYLYLGFRIAEMVVAISKECHIQWDDNLEMHPQVEEKIKDFLSILKEIRSVVRKRLRTSFLSRVLKTQELKDNLVRCNQRLEDAFRLFSLPSLISIQQKLHSHQVPVVPKAEVIDRFKLSLDKFEKDEYVYRTTQKYVITRGTCVRGQQKVKAFIKSYPSSRDRNGFQQEVALAKGIRHPNLHEFFGYFSEDEEDIVVYSGCESSDVQMYLEAELECRNPFSSFSVVTQMLQGIAVTHILAHSNSQN
ncbi:hypothetical protein SCHPADRAFT_301325 [Schizopora paradoxa]|uniref:Protein kinase domain-containing protein n=1 Tax=Schizopora paradoxa TaxID=27342 RepID=A0A0H2RYT3_9AGAM|nr:hypothetical protein SCHPADRAFT_301325 [Schizopora paradoxa]